MKKNIVIASFSAVAALLVSVSCTKQDLSQQQTESVVEGGTFTAVIEQNFTKTTLTDELKVHWENGDRVIINGKYIYAVSPKVPATKASFYPVGDEAPESVVYQVYYPENILKDGVGFLPYKQVYRKGSLNTPMYAESYTKELSFQNICGVLHFALSGTDKVGSISVTTAGELVSGTFNVRPATDSQGNPVKIAVPNGNVDAPELKTVTLDCGENGVQLDSEKPTDFYISLPPQEYQAGLVITVTRTDGTTFEKTTVKNITISRNAIYNLDWNVDKSVNETLAQFFKDMVKDQAALAAATDEATKGSIVANQEERFLPEIHTWENTCAAIKAIDKGLDLLESEVTKDTPQWRQQEGELQFFRALLYFELFRTYGKAPIVWDGYKTPCNLSDVFGEIEKSAKMSADLLSSSYEESDRIITVEEGVEVTRPTKWAAKALMARLYLYASSPLFGMSSRYADIDTFCRDIINGREFSLEDVYSNLWGDNAFNNKELIFGVHFTTPSSAYNVVHPTDYLYSCFDSNDLRLSSTIEESDELNLKKPINQIIPIFRYADILLVCAEADLNKGDMGSATQVCNNVRQRAGLNAYSQVQADDIESERIYELAFEGHRFWDVRRLKKGSECFGHGWSDDYSFYPVPGAINIK